MSASKSYRDDPWCRLQSFAASSEYDWSDVATLLRFRDDADSFHPMYLFWDLYRPTLRDNEGVRSPAPRLTDQDESLTARLASIKEAMLEAGQERDLSRVIELSSEHLEVEKQLDWAKREANPDKRVVLEVLDLLYQRHRIGYEPDGDDSDIRTFLEAHDGGPPDDMVFPAVFKNALVFTHVTAARAIMLH